MIDRKVYYTLRGESYYDKVLAGLTRQRIAERDLFLS